MSCFFPFNLANLDLRTACIELGELQHKWYDLGIALGVPEHKLKEFKSTSSPFSETISYWLKGNCEGEGVPICWETVVKTLQTPLIGEFGLAKTLQAKYCAEGELV